MLKRIIVFAFVLSALILIALAPMNVNQAPADSAKLQETLVVTVAMVTATPSGGIPVTGFPASTTIILGLLVLLGIAVVIGGIALMSRRA